MKREQVAAGVTVAVIAGVIVTLAICAPRSGGPEEEVKPSSVVFDLFQRAKAGDVGGYLSCFDQGLRETVESSKRDMGDGAFKQHIASIGDAVKGVSVSEERADKTEARLRVELVYADRTHNDVQTFSVVRRGSRWLITSMSGASQLKMPVPYGTPAYPLEGNGSEQEATVNGEQGPADEQQGGR